MGHRHGKHGNPEDLEGYLAKLTDPSRADWQKPDEVIRALALRPTDVVADAGAGPGFFALPLAQQVAHVFAAEVEPRILEVLRERLRREGVRNVTPILALENDPLLPRHGCDVVLAVNAFHHVTDGDGWLRRLAGALKPFGRLVNIDWHKRDTGIGPPVEHRVAREEFLRIAEQAGFVLAEEHSLLPHQYFVVMTRAGESRLD